MKDFLKIGIIQPVLDENHSWGSLPKFEHNILPLIADRVWEEISEGLKLIIKQDNPPQIILIPELHIPTSKVQKIKDISKKHNIMIIAGIDFIIHPTIPNKIRNRGIITLPNLWGTQARSSTRLTSLYFGKTHFSYMERSMFKKLKLGTFTEDPERNMYLFQTAEYGNFGLMICSDIFDIDRMLVYQGRIHHLFIISLNKDLNSYFHMAEALCRLIYCNVVICNTGFFGGSLAISPYQDTNERMIYKYQGQRMFNYQTVDIPVKALNDAQLFDFSGNKKEAGIIFKASPPGYKKL